MINSDSNESLEERLRKGALAIEIASMLWAIVNGETTRPQVVLPKTNKPLPEIPDSYAAYLEWPDVRN